MDRLLTVEEAADRLGTSVRFVRFHSDDLAEYVAAQRVEAARPAAGRLRAVGDWR